MWKIEKYNKNYHYLICKLIFFDLLFLNDRLEAKNEVNPWRVNKINKKEQFREIEVTMISSFFFKVFNIIHEFDNLENSLTYSC